MAIASLAKRVARRARNLVKPTSRETGIEYWESRARQYGPRSVFHIGHATEEEDRVLHDLQKREIFPLLSKELTGRESTILDFGCGVGHFSAHLADIIGGHCFAIDPIQSLLDSAPKAETVTYKLLPKDCCIPLPSQSVDVAWICIVLSGIDLSLIDHVCAELVRVLTHDGLLFLIDNTSEKVSTARMKFRSIADYRRLFPSISLRHLGEYFDLGERYSILAGRASELNRRVFFT